MADAALGTEQPMVVLLAVGRPQALDEVVRRQPLAALHAAEALRMPDAIEEVVAVLEKKEKGKKED